MTSYIINLASLVLNSTWALPRTTVYTAYPLPSYLHIPYCSLPPHSLCPSLPPTYRRPAASHLTHSPSSSLGCRWVGPVPDTLHIQDEQSSTGSRLYDPYLVTHVTAVMVFLPASVTSHLTLFHLMLGMTLGVALVDAQVGVMSLPKPLTSLL